MQPTLAPSPTDRLEAYLAELGRLSVDDLSMLSLPEPDPDERARLLQAAVDAAADAGRRETLAEAPGKARDKLFRAYAFRAYEPTWFGLNWGRSLGRADDRARLAAAVEDAAVAAVVGDLLPEDVLAALRVPFEIAASMAGAASDTNPSTRGEARRRPVVAAAFVAGLFGAMVSGAFVLVGAIMAAAALLAGRGRRNSR